MSINLTAIGSAYEINSQKKEYDKLTQLLLYKHYYLKDFPHLKHSIILY